MRYPVEETETSTQTMHNKLAIFPMHVGRLYAIYSLFLHVYTRAFLSCQAFCFHYNYHGPVSGQGDPQYRMWAGGYTNIVIMKISSVTTNIIPKIACLMTF